MLEKKIKIQFNNKLYKSSFFRPNSPKKIQDTLKDLIDSKYLKFFGDLEFLLVDH